MSGHSKWHNIQGRKNAQDAKRGKIFQKLSRDIYMAAKSGGPDPDANPQLRLVMDKARAANMPKDNIKRALDKGYIAIAREDLDVDEDAMLEDALNAGADDLQASEEVFEIYTDPQAFEDVRNELQNKYDLDTAEITMVPQNTVPVPADKVEQLQRLIDRLEDEDDVSEVFTSAEFPDED